MSKRPTCCDFCNRRIRLSQHALLLRDFSTEQAIGRYHVRPDCQVAAADYFVSGVAIRATIFHPERCGSDLESCDAGAVGVA
jgi:hypothetical protein